MDGITTKDYGHGKPDQPGDHDTACNADCNSEAFHGKDAMIEE